MIQINERDPHVVELRTAENKLNDLTRENHAIQERLEALQRKYGELRALRQQDRLDIEAESLLSGTPIAEVSSAEIEDTQHQLEIMDRAIDKQRELVDRARSQFTRVMCEANRSRYLEIAKRISRAVTELAEANEAEYKFFEELRDAGATSITFRPVRVNAVGLATDTQSVAAFHRRELEEFVPEALQ